jgi:hypothetical protein
MIDREFVEIAIPWLALVVSIIALVLSARLSKRQNELQEQENRLGARIVELEEGRDRAQRLLESQARVEVSFQRRVMVTGKIGPFLVLTNSGRAEAADLRVTLNGDPIEQCEMTPTARDPIRLLGPGAEQAYLLMVTFGKRRGPLDVVIQWRDASGTDGHYRTQLEP